MFHALATRFLAFIRRVPRLALLALGLVVLGLGAWAVFSSGGGDKRPTMTQKVAIGDVEDTVTAVGALQPLQFVDVGTQVSGQVKKLHVTYGEAVTQGKLLAEIDPTIYQAQVNAGEAQLLNLQAQLAQRKAERTLAQQQLGRQKALLAERATSQDAFDAATSTQKVNAAQIAALEAQIKQATSTLNVSRANLGYTKIYAPMNGVVVDLIAKQGQTLNANQTAPLVLRIADLDTMTVYAQVSEADVAKLKIGMGAYFTTLGQVNRKRYGKLRQIIPTPQLVNNVVLYNSLFDVENPDHDLLTQMTAQVFFVIAEAKQVPVVPVTALKPLPAGPRAGAPKATADAQQPTSTKPGGDGRGEARGQRPPRKFMVNVKDGSSIVEREVEVGVMNRLVAEIKTGLSVGDEVVIELPRGAASSGGPPPGAGMGRGPRI